MGMKRLREEDQDETVATANCLMLLSKVGEETEKVPATYVEDQRRSDRIFECKTCKKKFNSFQALGGHRASHKKLRLMAADLLQRALSPAKPKTHSCSICGLDFPMGQALGGHMRRHRQFVRAEEEKSSSSSVAVAVADYKTDDVKSVPILTRSASCKRIFGFGGLDLNLTPDENDLKLRSTSNSPPTPFFHVIA